MPPVEKGRTCGDSCFAKGKNWVCSNTGVTVNSHRLCFFWDALNSPNHLPHSLPTPPPNSSALSSLPSGCWGISKESLGVYWSPSRLYYDPLDLCVSRLPKVRCAFPFEDPLFSSIASLLLLPFPPLEVVSPHQVGLLSIQLLPRKRDCSCLLFLPQCCFPKATYCSFSSFSLCFCDPCCYLTLDHAFFL